LSGLEQQLEESYRQREELNKQLKRLQQQLNNGQTEVEEIKADRDKMAKDLREAERRQLLERNYNKVMQFLECAKLWEKQLASKRPTITY
jgi:uncharacterized coiled-coil DUF342 family protein